MIFMAEIRRAVGSSGNAFIRGYVELIQRSESGETWSVRRSEYALIGEQTPGKVDILVNRVNFGPITKVASGGTAVNLFKEMTQKL